MRSPADLAVVQAEPFFTRDRLRVAVVLAAILLAGGTVAYARVISKNRGLKTVAGALEGARDELARGVARRAEQVQEQLSARHEQQAVFSAINEERNRIARDLHDSVQQYFASAALRLETISLDIPPAVEKRVASLVGMLRQGQEEVRRSVWSLRDMALERHSLEDAMRVAIGLLMEGSGVEIDISFTGAESRLPSDVANHLLRCAQETASNSLRHSRARHLSFVLEIGDDFALLTGKDDGIGFLFGTKDAEGKYGLRDLGERARLMGGTLEIRSTPGAGTSVCLRVPLAQPTATTTIHLEK